MPKEEGDITLQGFPVTKGQKSGIVARENMEYMLYNIFKQIKAFNYLLYQQVYFWNFHILQIIVKSLAMLVSFNKSNKLMIMCINV